MIVQRYCSEPMIGMVLTGAALMQLQVAAFAPFAQPAISSPHCSGALYRAARPLPRSVKGVCVASSQADTAEATDSSAAKSSGKGGKDVVPSYRRLYDAAMELLEVELELEAYPIPEGLAGKSATVGTGRNQQRVETSIMAFQAPKLRQIRVALVETDGPTQVLNFVIFPDPSYDLPIFGADLVSLPGVHLVCIDLQPARDGQTLGDGNDAALKEINRRHAKGLPWGGELPDAARKYFSRSCLWSKMDPKQPVEEKALNAMMDYLREFLRLVASAEAEGTDSALAKLTEGQADYCNYRRVNDPARGMLTRFYGAEWTEAVIEGILFDFRPKQEQP